MIYVDAVMKIRDCRNGGKPQNVSIGISINVIEQYSVYMV